jgi:uncharacterized DUF497 family protein
MRGRAAGFEWDDGNWPKCSKHGLSRAEIESVIAAARFMVDDPSPREKRYRTAGRAPTGRHVFVVFTYWERSGSVYVRPISARYMHRQEIESYEEEVARLEQR